MSQYTSKKLSSNIVYSIVQILVAALVVFLLYRYAIAQIGIHQFGIWSVVSTIITSLGILNYGFSGSLVKYVAKFQSKGEPGKVRILIETSVLSVSVFVLILGVIGYLLFTVGIHYLLPNEQDVLLSKKLIKICILTFCISMIASTFQSALEGLNDISSKSLINCVVSVVLLISAFVYVSRFGLLGLGYSYLTANLVGLVCSVYMLSVKFPSFSLLKCRWNKQMFRETLRYNYNFQVISIFSLLNDPVTKLLLTKFGGTEYTGLYELASKLVLQVRNILATANQALVPIFSSLHETNPDKVEQYFKNSFFYVYIVSTFFFFSVIAFAPLFSTWWLGSVNNILVFLIDAVAVGWFLNAITMPAYFANLGSGNMRWNTRSHVGMGLSNLVLSCLLGFFFDPLWICMGWLFSLAFFSLLIIVFYLHENSLDWQEMMPFPNWIYLAVAISSSGIVSFYLLTFFSADPLLLVVVVLAYLSVHGCFLLMCFWGRSDRGKLLPFISRK